MDDYDYEYDESEGEGPPRGRIVATVIAVLCLGGLGFLLISNRGGDEQSTSPAPDSTLTTVAAPADSVGDDETDEEPDDTTGDSTATTDLSTESDTTVATTDSSDDPDDADSSDDTSSSDSTTSSTSTSTTSSTSTTAAPATPAGTITYPVLPDGTPRPIVGIFDTDSITLSGIVHSEDAKARLQDLAIATSKFPDATMINLLTIDPTIPPSVGVRVIELNSVRFPESSAEISAEHSLELDRAIGVMKLFPNVSLDVIGHADQRGDPDANFRLSEQRAQSVTSYFVANGIAPERLAARAVGADDLLSVGDSDAALALNRRTEFIFYGLLLDPVEE